MYSDTTIAKNLEYELIRGNKYCTIVCIQYIGQVPAITEFKYINDNFFIDNEKQLYHIWSNELILAIHDSDIVLLNKI